MANGKPCKACAMAMNDSVGKTPKKKKAKVGAMDKIPMELIGGVIVGKVATKKFVDPYLNKVGMFQKNPIIKQAILVGGGVLVSGMGGELVEGLGIGIAVEGAEQLIMGFLNKPSSGSGSGSGSGSNTPTDNTTVTDTSGGVSGIEFLGLNAPPAQINAIDNGLYQQGSKPAMVGKVKINY